MQATIEGVRQIVTLTRDALYGLDPDSGKTLWTQPVPNFRGMNILTPLVVDGAIFTSPYKQRSFLYSVRRTGEKLLPEQRWENKSTGYMSSPVVIDDHIYLHLANGRLECLAAGTGEARWRSEPMGRYWSMSHQSDKILALNEKGKLFLLRASAEAFELLDSRAISEPETWGHLAVDGNQLFVRELEGIAAYRWLAGSDAAARSELGPTTGGP